MIRRVIVNLLLTYLFIPLVIVGRIYYMFEFGEGVEYYSGDFESYILDRSIGFIFTISTLYLVFLLVHNAIILHYREKDKELTFVRKIGVLWLVHLIFIGLGVFIYQYIYLKPFWNNLFYLPITLIPSIIFASAIHYLVDLPETKKLEKKLEIE